MKSAFLTLGAFCIAYNLANFLHELGHAVAAWICGGSVASIVLNPFSWNWITFRSNPNPLFTTWGGVLFGVSFAVLISVGAMLLRSSYLAPLYLLGGCALAVNGIYLAIAAFADVGDAGSLIFQGVPRHRVVSVGLVLIAAAVLWLSLCQPLLGIRHDASFAQRLLVLHIGVLPYLAAMGLYVVLLGEGEARLFLAFAGAGLLALIVISCVGHLCRGISARLFDATQPTGASAAIILGLGVFVVVGELLLFASDTQ